MVMLTVVDDMITFCLPSTARTVPVFTTVCTEYHEGCTVDDKKSKTSLVRYKHFPMGVDLRQNIQIEILHEIFNLKYFLPTGSHMLGLQTVIYIFLGLTSLKDLQFYNYQIRKDFLILLDSMSILNPLTLTKKYC